VGFDYLYSAIYVPYWTSEELLDSISEVTLEDIGELTSQFSEHLYTHILIHGNLVNDTAQEISDAVTNLFTSAEPVDPLLVNKIPQIIPQGSLSYFHESFTVDAATVVYFQVESYNFHEAAIVAVLEQLLSERAFNVLRTQQQLGYIVGVSSESDEGLGLYFYVESNTYSAADLDEQIENFIQVNWRNDLTSLSNDQLAVTLSAIIDSINQPPLSPFEETQQYWDEIVSERKIFDRKERLTDHLRALSVEDIRTFSSLYLFDDASRRRLSVHLDSSDSPNDFPTTVIDDTHLNNTTPFPEENSTTAGIDPPFYHRENFPSEHEGLSGGAIAGIILATIVVIIIFITVVYMLPKSGTDDNQYRRF